IRDLIVTGVQTCALPIWSTLLAGRHALRALPHAADGRLRRHRGAIEIARLLHGLYRPFEHRFAGTEWLRRGGPYLFWHLRFSIEIGRASCRERGYSARGG